MTREVELSAGTLRVRDSGEGPPLVFVHGALVDGTLWRKVVPELERDYRCIVPDLPLGSHRLPLREGADTSPPGIARMIGELLDALDLRDATLVANDTGGALVQILIASGDTERIDRVVLTNCDAFKNFFPPPFRPLTWIARMPGGVMAVAQPLRIGVLRRYLGFGLLSKRRIPDEVTRGWLDPLLSDAAIRRDTSAVIGKVHRRHTLAAAEKLGSFGKPVLLAWSPGDRIFPFKHARQLAELFPDARIEEIPDSGAFVPEDQPERLAEAIRGFVPARTAKGQAAA